ncbi:TOBE domain-containing protein [Streptomyces sp. NA04227]|uniref:TOBE domain-containing protein n=1 Tax=Streptomyces sp. NA04227 TaxID=2742136 RepID=UPI00158FA34F|nr:TOBE domain-containing protein [Streptomyces sp. NA04227]QKW07533.1 TOBE domain-containing protein [Streptomyces sp. NA04227]
MPLSIRNQIPGTVLSITAGEVMATVKVRLDGGQELTAVVTLDAVRELGLVEGSAVRALTKSTEVALATGALPGLSIRNQLPGTVSGVTVGGALASVGVTIDGGELTAVITKEAATELRLSDGSPVMALMKATEVSLATG